MFKEVGDPSKEGKTEKLSRMRIEYLKNYPTLGMAPLSVCPVRSRAALSVMSCSLLFLHAHEVAHIVLGHLDLLKDLFGMGAYEELPVVPLSTRESELRRVLELQADQSAALTSLHIFRRQLHADAGKIEFQDADFLWSIAVESLFVLLHLAMARKGSRSFSTHPSFLARWLNVKLCVDERAEEHGIHRLQLPETRPTPMGQVISWLSANGLIEGGALFPHDAVHAAEQEVFSTWAAIAPYEARLQSYRAGRGNRAVQHVAE
jgi:hypothetical protein